MACCNPSKLSTCDTFSEVSFLICPTVISPDIPSSFCILAFKNSSFICTVSFKLTSTNESIASFNFSIALSIVS